VPCFSARIRAFAHRWCECLDSGGDYRGIHGDADNRRIGKKEDEFKNTRCHPKGEAATCPCEALATILLPKNRRIQINKMLDSLLDVLAV